MPEIVLATLNAKWIHASFGLRYLRANLGDLRDRSIILEFDLQARIVDVAEALLSATPRIVGLGVYVWNARETLQLVRVLKQLRPELYVVLGGPEISYETEQQELALLADYVIRGEADLAFPVLCRALLENQLPELRTIDATPPRMEDLAFPYDEYDATDLAHRVVYVEASRGCPFTCEFCLSALEVPVRQVPLPEFLSEMERLLERGLRHFKFVDRTFNLNLKTSAAILRFFLERWTEGLFLHFEMIPDRLPAGLRELIAAFPPGALQFEVGIQSLDPATSERISRRQDVPQLAENLIWLREHTGVHVHADLIVGLPGEDLASFAQGFDRLLAWGPEEIQVGILKRLRGTPIIRHDVAYGMTWSTEAPYEVLQTSAIAFTAMQSLKRFARYWDLVANQGRFVMTLPLLLQGSSAFGAFSAFSTWLWKTSSATHGISFHRLAELIYQWLHVERGLAPSEVGRALAEDYLRLGKHDGPEWLRPWLRSLSSERRADRSDAKRAMPEVASRQARHGRRSE